MKLLKKFRRRVIQRVRHSARQSLYCSLSRLRSAKGATVSIIEQQIRPVLVGHPEIRLAILFGSSASGGEGFESDVDLAIDVGASLSAEAKMVLIGELAEHTGRPIDLIDLRAVGEPLLGQIVGKGVRLAGDDTAYADLIKRHWFEEADFMPYYRRVLAERRRSWIVK